MSTTPEDNRFAVPIGELERGANVPLDEQTTEQPAGPPDVTDGDWLDQRRQARLAGGL